MEKLKPYLPWIFRAAALLVVILLVAAWNSARSSRNELATLLEREKLEKAKLIVEIQSTKADMKEQERNLLMANADLEVEVARLKDVLGKTPKIIEVIKWRTKEVPVEVAGPATTIQLPCPKEGGSVACLLPPGSTGHVEALELTYETKENNHVLIGKASCWRDTPAPAVMLFSSTFSSDMTSAMMQKEQVNKMPGWGGGLRGSVDNIGWAVGPVLAFPALPFLFNTQIEFSLDLTFGTPWLPKDGVPAITAQVGGVGVLRGR